jgi:hypothetical protein
MNKRRFFMHGAGRLRNRRRHHLPNDTTDTPRRRQRSSATRVSPFARGRTGGVIARSQERLFVSLSPGAECQPVGSWRMTPEKPITTGGR